jgi:hypothetical protein
VWLMGVWQRSPAGVAIALSNDELCASFAAAVPDWEASDVVGSPYCVRGYVVDDHFGGPDGLASAREALASRGMGLILDFVRLRAGLGRAGRTSPEHRLLADGGPCDPREASGVLVPGRGLLGPRVGTAAAGLRLLLRQATLRPHPAGASRAGAAPPASRRRIQLEGATVHLPVFLGRYPNEPADAALHAFYRTFLPAIADPTFRHGRWRLCDRFGWPGDDRYQNLVAWCWDGDTRWLIVVNLSDGAAAGLVRTPWANLRGRRWQLTDPTQSVAFVRSGDDLVDGLFVELDAWRRHMFRIDPLADNVPEEV